MLNFFMHRPCRDGARRARRPYHCCFQPFLELLEDRTVPSTRFAVIGDYGSGSQNEADVANLVKSWSPQFILTTGDNNYPHGEATTIDPNIGQFYQTGR